MISTTTLMQSCAAMTRRCSKFKTGLNFGAEQLASGLLHKSHAMMMAMQLLILFLCWYTCWGVNAAYVQSAITCYQHTR
jgi:hypothetical protein